MKNSIGAAATNSEPRSVDIAAPVGRKLEILVLLGSFWPGNHASGPHQSLIGWCDALKEHANFLVVARDRPFGATKAITSDQGWTDLGFARFSYREVRHYRVKGLRRLIQETPHDIIVCNGFFDPTFTLNALLYRKLRLIPDRPMILSPRGEFSPGAIALKAYKKNPYRAAIRALGLLDGVWLHAASRLEQADIERSLPGCRRIVFAPNVRSLSVCPDHPNPLVSDHLRLAFISRIDRKKNLDYALRALSDLTVKVRFDIFGPVSDEAYWSECGGLIAKLPANVQVRYLGTLPPEAIANSLAGYDAMLCPTRGENYGHAIVDALAAGVPVIISDQTPWQRLQDQCAGWSLPLAHPEGFAAALNQLYETDQAQRLKLRRGARRLAEAILADGDAAKRSLEMFRHVASSQNAPC